MAGKTPEISVVIPLYQATPYLTRLVRHLEAQTCRRERFEVLLVDDCSPDHTSRLAAQLEAATALNLRLVQRASNGGVSATRNTGWRAALAPLILFIDQDCLAQPELITSHLNAHQRLAGQNRERSAVLGRIIWSTDYQENPASEQYKAAYFPPWDRFKPEGPNFFLFITSNASVPKAGLEQIGGFDEPFRHNHEDILCGYRLESQAGYRMELCPQALVIHDRPLPVPEVFRRSYVVGREMARLFEYYPELVGHPTQLDPAQFLDWTYRLTTLDNLLAETLGAMTAAEIEALRPLLEYSAGYLAAHPINYHFDPDYSEMLVTGQAYRREQERVRWLEAGYRQATAQLATVQEKIARRRQSFIGASRTPAGRFLRCNYLRARVKLQLRQAQAKTRRESI